MTRPPFFAQKKQHPQHLTSLVGVLRIAIFKVLPSTTLGPDTSKVPEADKTIQTENEKFTTNRPSAHR